MIELILTTSLARIFEAFRDAESFQRPNENRSTIWHILKFPQYSMWLLTGWQLQSFNDLHDAVLVISLALMIAFVIFEVSLRFFRKIL